MFVRHPLLSLATFAYLGVVAWLTLGPQPFPEGEDSFAWKLFSLLSRLDDSGWLSYSRFEFIGNLLMFIPVGLFFLLLLGRARWLQAGMLGVVLTLGIEFVQMFLPERVSDVRDLVANSAGALIGVIVALLVTAKKARMLRRARLTASSPDRSLARR